MKKPIFVAWMPATLLGVLLANLVSADITKEETIRRAHEFNYYKNELPDSIKSEIEMLSQRLKDNFVGIGIEYNVKKVIVMHQPEFIVEAEVMRVFKNGPAEKAGIKAGDRILEINDKAITTEKSVTDEIKGNGQVGREILLKIDRNDERMEIRVKTAKFGFGLDPVLKYEAERVESSIKRYGNDIVDGIRKSAAVLAEKLELGGSIEDEDRIDVIRKLGFYENIFLVVMKEWIDELIAPR